MSLPLKITCYDPGLGGVPTTTTPRDLSGWADDYSDSLLNELGCETCRITGRVSSIEAAVDWTQRLMAAVEVYTPTGRGRFFGFLHDVSIPALEVSISLTDMANAVIVRYTDPDGKKGTQTATNSGSIAKFGRKELVLNFSTVYAAEATNRASTVLAQLVYPSNKQTVSIERADDGDGFKIELTFRGWAETLKWLTTSSTTTATAVTSTQVTSLITTYNSTNNFFDTSSAQVTSTGFSATQYCDPDTTYFERIATLLAAGNSSQQRVAWGFYTRAITIGVTASATPDTISYYYSKRTKTLRDASGNIIPPWDWAPDTMIQNTDAIEPPVPSGTIATLTRKYIKRVTLSIDKDGKVAGTLEPDDPDKLPEFLAKPVSVTAGVSERHAQIESRIAKISKVRTIAADNSTIYNSSTGVLQPAAGGTGTVNTGTIDTGGGNVSNTGGGSVDLGTGSGIGGAGSSAALGTGTSGRVAEWASSTTLQAATLIKSGAGVVTLSASSTVTLTIDNSIRLANSGPASGDVLTYNGSAYAPATPSYGPTNATYITQTTNSTLSNEQALSALSTGVMKSTTTTGVVSTMTGTSGRVTEWSDGTTIGASTLIKSGAGVMTLSASSTVTLTIDSSTRLDGAGASSGDVLTWGGTAYAPAAPATGAPSNAKYITQTSDATLSNEQALSSLSTGVMKSTTTTGVVSTMTGTSGRITEWSDGTTIGASTLIKSGAGVLTLSASGTATLTIDSSTRLDGAGAIGGDILQFNGTAFAPEAAPYIGGSGTSGRIAYWSSGSTITSDADFLFDGTRMALGASINSAYRVLIKGTGSTGSSYGLVVQDAGGSNTFYINDNGSAVISNGLQVGGQLVTNSIQTVTGNVWDMGAYTSTGDVASNGWVAVTIDGTLRKLMTRA